MPASTTVPIGYSALRTLITGRVDGSSLECRPAWMNTFAIASNTPQPITTSTRARVGRTRPACTCPGRTRPATGRTSGVVVAAGVPPGRVPTRPPSRRVTSGRRTEQHDLQCPGDQQGRDAGVGRRGVVPEHDPAEAAPGDRGGDDPAEGEAGASRIGDRGDEHHGDHRDHERDHPERRQHGAADERDDDRDDRGEDGGERDSTLIGPIASAA